MDTSILIAALRSDPAVAERLEEAEEVYTSAIALGELFFGTRRSGRAEENRAQVESLAQDMTILRCDRGTAESYAVLKDELWRKGRPIPDNDLWIAATAQQHDLTLVARDKHFDGLDGLDIASW